MSNFLYQKQLPVTVLTGFLGAGKTTLLNRVLSEQHGRRFGVIVNEFSEQAIDGDLIIKTDEDIIELSNGCLCCSIRKDLLESLESLARRASQLDAVLIETTGLADPLPIAQIFFLDDTISDQFRLDAIITVVDAVHGQQTMAEHDVARRQVGCADLVLLNKTADAPPGLETFELRLQGFNRLAPLLRTNHCAIPISDILDRNAFALAAHSLMQSAGNQQTILHTDHMDDIGSISLTSSLPLDAECFRLWIQKILVRHGDTLLRMKGIVAFHDEKRKFIFHGVRTSVSGDIADPWQESEKRETKIVFIGKDLNRAELTRDFKSCIRKEYIKK